MKDRSKVTFNAKQGTTTNILIDKSYSLLSSPIKARSTPLYSNICIHHRNCSDLITCYVCIYILMNNEREKKSEYRSQL